jgi:hypothetical protein
MLIVQLHYEVRAGESWSVQVCLDMTYRIDQAFRQTGAVTLGYLQAY